MDPRIEVTTAATIAMCVCIAIGVAATGKSPGGERLQGASVETSRDLDPLRDPDGFSQKGEAAIENLCAKVCHNVDKVFVARRSPRDWALVMADMTRRGAKGLPDERDLVRRYLTWSFGVVAVNSSSAEDLAAVIGLPIATAESIVAHRQRHGRFADMNALAQVPGLERGTLEAQVDALRFD
jgi:competence ComEA-like helix-hairpin-helix protein